MRFIPQPISSEGVFSHNVYKNLISIGENMRLDQLTKAQVLPKEMFEKNIVRSL